MLPNWNSTHIAVARTQAKKFNEFSRMKASPRNYHLLYPPVNRTKQLFLRFEKTFWYLKKLSGDYLIGMTLDCGRSFAPSAELGAGLKTGGLERERISWLRVTEKSVTPGGPSP
jgi:hypothetical protein